MPTHSILILTDAPTAPLYVPRMRYLISYLHRQGWQCTVAYEQVPGSTFTYSDAHNIAFTYYPKNNPTLHRLRWLADKTLSAKERRIYALITKQCRTQHFDLILCSTFNTFPLTAAARLAQQWHCPLIADLRDIAEQWGQTAYTQSSHTPQNAIARWFTTRLNHLYTQRCIRQRNKALRQADCITTVSTWHRHFLRQRFPNVHLIYNGFDEHIYIPKDLPTQKFIISYTGKIYDFHLRNPQLLFDALHQLHSTQRLPNELEVHFYCEPTIQHEIHHLAQQAQVSQHVFTHDFVSNAEALQIMHQSSICLLLTNKAGANGPHGIMTTKFYEFIGIEKPVLCVRSDEECLAQAIQDTHIGIAATHTDEVCHFILDKYNEWQHNGFTRQPVQNKQAFMRLSQAQQFAHLILSLCQP